MESKAIKIPWLLVCAMVAYWGFTFEGEQRIIPVLALCVLTFPVGILFFGTVSIVYITPILFGYLQWFVVLPKIVKKFKSGDRSLLLIIILGALFIVAGLYLFCKSVVPDVG